MGKLIISHQDSLFLRNRRYVINIDDTTSGELFFGNKKVEFELAGGLHTISITAGNYSVIETVEISEHIKTMNILPSASQKGINALLIGITIIVLTTFFLFLKNGQSSVQLLLFIILIPLYLVIFTSRKKSAESFLVVTT